MTKLSDFLLHSVSTACRGCLGWAQRKKGSPEQKRAFGFRGGGGLVPQFCGLGQADHRACSIYAKKGKKNWPKCHDESCL